LLKDMWSANDSVPDIAAALGVTVKAVYALRFKYRLPVRKLTPGRPRLVPKRVRDRPRIERIAFDASST
jgi:hypothetical protein